MESVETMKSALKTKQEILHEKLTQNKLIELERKENEVNIMLITEGTYRRARYCITRWISIVL